MGPVDADGRSRDGVAGGRPLVTLLRGAPGVGKSTAAALLGERGVVRAIVEVDAFRRLVVGTDWADRRLHSAAMCAAARAAAEFAVAGFGPVLLIDCFGRDHAQAASHIVKGRGLEAAVITLWARPDVLRARLARRIGGYDDEQMALLMNAEMAAGGGALLDATEVDVQQLVEQIRVLIQGRS